MAGDEFRAGRHEALIESLGTDVAQVKTDIAWIKTRLSEQTGERRVALYFAASGGGIIATLVVATARHFLKL